jgi:dihydrofolate synthase/folylpolyglutamate synthase
MKPLQTLEEAMAAFLTYAPPSMKGKYTLDRIRKLMAYLGNPQDTLRVIHIAGTSGKTSTAYFIRGLLESVGQRTGLTVSPHITAINERVQVAGVPLAADRFLAYANDFFGLVRNTDLEPTYFELVIAFAYWVFAKEKVDYAVIETGLGGLLDGTNIVARSDKTCVITDIGLDHTEILGDTITKIAAQKAGIIQKHNHVIARSQDISVMEVISAAAHQQAASLQIVGSEAAPAQLPTFQHRNWAMAMAAFHYVQQSDNLAQLTDTGLDAVALQTPPGRWEQYHLDGKRIILDGGHNPQKLQALYASLRQAGITSAAVMANLTEVPDTNKITDSLSILQPITAHLIIPEFTAGQDLKSRHSVAAAQLQTYATSCGITSTMVQPDIPLALELLLQRPEATLIITGSLYLVSAVRPFLLQKVHESTDLQ